MFCPVLAKIFQFIQHKQFTQKQSTLNSRNSLLCITHSEQQKHSTPYNVLHIARFYSVQVTISSSTRYKNTTRVVTLEYVDRSLAASKAEIEKSKYLPGQMHNVSSRAKKSHIVASLGRIINSQPPRQVASYVLRYILILSFRSCCYSQSIRSAHCTKWCQASHLARYP